MTCDLCRSQTTSTMSKVTSNFLHSNDYTASRCAERIWNVVSLSESPYPVATQTMDSTALPNGTRLCEDIKILLLSGPSIAKYQMLQATKRAAPISVNISRKGSLASILSYGIARNRVQCKLELEVAAMVFADGSFDSIDKNDRMWLQKLFSSTIHQCEKKNIQFSKLAFQWFSVRVSSLKTASHALAVSITY